MSSKNNFDLPVWKLRSMDSATSGFQGDVGIEVELEGALIGHLPDPLHKYWVAKSEGSLRNGGIEYIVHTPVPISQIDFVTADFGKIMAKCKPEITIRCSTHVHVNVSKLKGRELYNAIIGWYLFESLFVATQPAKRRGNLFCLMMEHSEHQFVSIRETLLGDPREITYYPPETNRYSALNLAAISKFGSLEFRFLDAMTNPELLSQWTKIFYHLVHNLSKITPKELLKQYDDMSPRAFIASVIGQEGMAFVTKGMTERGLNRLLQTNYDYVFELSSLASRTKYETPSSYWDDDSDRTGGRPSKKIGLSSFAYTGGITGANPTATEVYHNIWDAPPIPTGAVPPPTPMPTPDTHPDPFAFYDEVSDVPDDENNF